jgi:dihydrofolate reductase
MTISLIVAMTKDRVIGKDNKLPWHLPEDLKHFKQVTMGHSIIMGRKTYESIGKALPGRTNIVITRNPNFKAEGVIAVSSLKEAIDYGNQKEEKFIIGGAEIFKEALFFADKIYLTLILDPIAGDTYFPEINWDENFKKVEESGVILSIKNSLPFELITLQRI